MKILIEGEDAQQAGAELATLEGMEATMETPEQPARRGMTLAAVASIVGIVNGSLAAAEQIRAWYERWKDAKAGTFNAVIELDDGTRISLDDATPDQIAAVLKSLEKE